VRGTLALVKKPTHIFENIAQMLWPTMSKRVSAVWYSSLHITSGGGASVLECSLKLVEVVIVTRLGGVER